ncbi:MAG: recombination protein RecR [Proteobacteria bacterium]|nr:recombination protein RecR [Pseudomonadota bacterium]NCA28910.1 recombination protein RecR [Pseudomonadota bacterium]
MATNVIENLSKIIAKLPGMGPRIAKKIVLTLALNKEKYLKPLILYLNELNEKVHNCDVCGNIDEERVCKICLDEKRDKTTLCIVEEVGDLWAIERSKNFNGKYFVLGGNLSAISGKNIEDLNFNKLISRVQNENFLEIIIATSATIDGQNTAHYIVDLLSNYDVKITRLGHGIPIGSELDYLDEGTISIALKTRSNF